MNTPAWVQERKGEIIGTSIGATSGLGVGAVIGGVGVAAMGTAVGVPAGLALMFVGGLIGNRVGMEKDRATDRRQRDSDDTAR